MDLGGPDPLTDQPGKPRTEADLKGHARLIFFGFANCQNICSATLPLMADITATLAKEGHAITPVMITIGPEQDTIETMAVPLAALHEDFVGLTGSRDEPSDAYRAFDVSFQPLFEDPEHGWINSHTSFLHLMDGNGDLLTVLPPMLSADQMVDILRDYVAPSG